jgi:hypothetical protein
MNNYADLFARQPAARLLEVVRHPDDYHPDAVAAAEAELARRQLTAEEQAAAEAAFRHSQTAATAFNDGVDKAVEGATDFGKNMVSWFDFSGLKVPGRTADSDVLDDPLGPEPLPASTRLRYITQVCCVFTLLFVVLNLPSIAYAVSNLFSPYPVWISLFALALFPLLVVGCYLFWRRERSGWFLFTLVVGLILVQEVNALVLSFYWFKRLEVATVLLSAGLQALYGFVTAFVLWLLHRPVVRAAYRITAQHLFWVDGVLLALLVLLLFGWRGLF